MANYTAPTPSIGGHARVVHASSQTPRLAGVYKLHGLSLNGRLLYKKLPHYQSELLSCFLLFGENSVTELVSTTGSTKWQLTLYTLVAGLAGFGAFLILPNF